MQKPESYLDEFDPNEMPEPYATYTYGRVPHFKLHSQLDHAASALRHNAASGCIIYERVGGRWEQIARVEQHYAHGDPDKSLMPQQCDACRRSTIKPNTSRWAEQGAMMNTARQFLERQNKRLVKPLRVITLCPDCRRGLGYGY